MSKKRRSTVPQTAIRDRIKEFRRVRAGDLVPCEKNWRTHPKGQVEAMRGILGEIGYADALLARQTPDGRLKLVDGHLRQSLDPDQEVPVLVLDLDEAEADKLMTVLDPLAAMAEANKDALGRLLAECQTESDAVQAMMEEMAKANGINLFESGAGDDQAAGSIALTEEKWAVFVECVDETQQRELLERLNGEGLTCRGLMI